MEETLSQPVDVLNRTTKIVMMAMAIATVCVSIVVVIVALEARSTQRNADATTRFAEQVAVQNEKLQAELSCLRDPAFQADKADSELSIIIARGLAALAIGDDSGLIQLGDDLNTGAQTLEAALDAREKSIQNCDKTP